MRWDSPLVLSVAGTLAIHLMVAVAGDAMVVLHPPQPDPPVAPHLEIVDVELPPIVKPPPPPPKRHAPDPKPDRPTNVLRPATQHLRAPSPPRIDPPPATPPPNATPDPDPTGGAPVISEPDLALGVTGVGVAVGPRNTGHVGRGGHGTGTGAGSGAGVAEVAAPVSVATIKTRAMARGDYAYDSIKDYPSEAKQLGIEGKIRVKLVVDEHGVVKSAVLLNRLGHGLDELALRRANLIAFEAAKDTDDRPVSSVVVWTFDMVPPR